MKPFNPKVTILGKAKAISGTFLGISGNKQSGYSVSMGHVCTETKLRQLFLCVQNNEED